MIASNEQIKYTLVWFVNFHSKKISTLVKEYLKEPKNMKEIQEEIDSHFSSIHIYTNSHKSLFPNEELQLNG